MKVVVLAGGISTERDVSLISGKDLSVMTGTSGCPADVFLNGTTTLII
ncbi:MAG: hypothetical protein ACLURV_07655 [Gallintestinimicrobium sp.]